MSGSEAPLLSIEGLWFRYGDGPPALRGVDLQIEAGQWLAVLGANGSGKSTLVKHFNGLLRPWKGVVRLDGVPIAGRQVGELARSVGYLPQNPDRMIFSATVREEVAFGPAQMGLRGDELNGRVDWALSLLELDHLAGTPPAILSYSLRRKVALAAVMAARPRLLLLDEPTNSLDAGCVARLMGTVEEMHRSGTTIVLVTHDLELALGYAGRALLMHGGQILSQEPTRQLLLDRETLVAAGLPPLPVTRLARRLAVSLPGFPPELLTPEELAEAWISIGKERGRP